MRASILNRVLLVLGFVGLFIAGLLSLEKASGLVVPCGPGGGCAAVSSHSSSYVGGVPVAYLGVFGYILLICLALMRSVATPEGFRGLAKLGMLVAGIGALMSVYLQFVSFTVIHAFCPYCFSSAVVMLATFLLHIPLLRAATETRNEVPLAAILFVATLGGLGISGTQLQQTSGASTEVSVDQAALLIPKNPKAIGPAGAAVTVVEFSDLCCPACQLLTPQVHKYAMQYPSTMRVIYRQLPLPIHPTAVPGSAIGEIAFEKGKFWEYLLAVMELRKDEKTTVDEMVAIANGLGITSDEIERRLNDPKDRVHEQIAMDTQAAAASGVRSTPTFFVIAKGIPTQATRGNAIFGVLEGSEYQKLLKGNAKN